MSTFFCLCHNMNIGAENNNNSCPRSAQPGGDPQPRSLRLHHARLQPPHRPGTEPASAAPGGGADRFTAPTFRLDVPTRRRSAHLPQTRRFTVRPLQLQLLYPRRETSTSGVLADREVPASPAERRGSPLDTSRAARAETVG